MERSVAFGRECLPGYRDQLHTLDRDDIHQLILQYFYTIGFKHSRMHLEMILRKKSFISLSIDPK